MQNVATVFMGNRSGTRLYPLTKDRAKPGVLKAITDKNVRVGDEVILTNKDQVEHADAGNYCIYDSIIVVPKNAVVPSGTFI